MRTRCSLATLLATLLAALLGACGDDAQGTADAAQYCTSACKWHATCGTADPACQANCEAEAAKGRASFFSAAGACFDQGDCSKSDDYCASVGYAAADDATSFKIKTDCLALRQSCQTITDDYCLQVAALSDSARAESAACLEKDCAQVNDCLRAAAGN